MSAGDVSDTIRKWDLDSIISRGVSMSQGVWSLRRRWESWTSQWSRWSGGLLAKTLRSRNYRSKFNIALSTRYKTRIIRNECRVVLTSVERHCRPFYTTEIINVQSGFRVARLLQVQHKPADEDYRQPEQTQRISNTLALSTALSWYSRRRKVAPQLNETEGWL